MPGGYIVSIRLVRADSGGELASFRETGDGPRGLIDAADKLARELRSKAGESLRAVNATPSLAQATTSSLDALRKYSEAVRLNALGENRALGVAREAVALDSTFCDRLEPARRHARPTMAGTSQPSTRPRRRRTAIRDRLPALERDMVTARYYALGAGRDRAKAIAAYEAILQRGDTLPTVLINLGEQLRSRREFARAESLNLAAARIDPSAATPLGNAVELQIDQGKLKEAAATNARLVDVAARYGNRHRLLVAFAERDDKTIRSMADSLSRAGGDARRLVGLPAEEAIALQDGRLARLRPLSQGSCSPTARPAPNSRFARFSSSSRSRDRRPQARRGSTRPSRRCRSATCPWWTARISIWPGCSRGWAAPKKRAP